MWSWQNLLVQSVSCLCLLKNTYNCANCLTLACQSISAPIQSLGMRPACLWCLGSVWTLSPEDCLYLCKKTARGDLMQLLCWGRTKNLNLNALWACCVCSVDICPQRPKLKPWMVLWLFIMSPGTFIADKWLLLVWTQHPPKDQRSRLSLGIGEKKGNVGTEQVNKLRDLRGLLKRDENLLNL